MEEVKLTPKELEFAGKLWGFSEEEKKRILSKLTAFQKRFLRAFPRYWQYKLVAEVVEANNCMRNAKPGDKMVFMGMGGWRSAESTLHCTWAAANMAAIRMVISDRVTAGIDIENMGTNYIRCPEAKLEEGGNGSVLFKIYFVKEKSDLLPNVHRPGVDDRIVNPY